jgi:hypothetical protein
MPPRKQHSGPPGRQTKVSRRQAREARDELAAGGLSHQERRKLRSVVRARDAIAGRRSLELRHIAVVAAGALAAMAVVAVSIGLVSAIQVASGQGTTGTFIVGYRTSCRTGCAWVGTFRYPDGDMVSGVIYASGLPPGDGPGNAIPAVETGGTRYVYPPHDSLRWVGDLLLVLVVGAAVGFLLLVSPLALGKRTASHTGAG